MSNYPIITLLETVLGKGRVSTNNNVHSGNIYHNTTSADCYAIKFDNSAAGNRVDGYFLNFRSRTPFLFTADGGLNTITGEGYAASGGATSFGGTKSNTTKVTYCQSGTVIASSSPILGEIGRAHV